MGARGSPMDRELYKRVDEVLHYVWDPIGVSGIPEARDEYNMYLPRVFALLKESANEERIADYLGTITTESMGLSAKREHDIAVARLLIDWKETIDDKYASRSA